MNMRHAIADRAFLEQLVYLLAGITVGWLFARLMGWH